jgi:IclR family pca regulon transcriptional regulator
MKETFELNRRDWIAGLQHGLAIIEAFDEANPRMTPAQVAERTGLTRTAARRHLLTLRALGYLDTNDKSFWLTPRVLRLGASYFESGRVPRLVQPFLQRLAASTNDAAYFSVNDADEVIYVARNGLNQTLNTGFVLGSRLPMTVTSAGFMLLSTFSDDALAAFLARYRPRPFTSQTIISKERLRAEVMRARTQGYAVMEQQLQVGMRGVAIVVRDHDDAVIGALSLTMPIGTLTAAQDVKRVLPSMQDTATTLRGLL